MEELTQEQIVEALGQNADLLAGVAAHVATTDKGTEIINNRANVLFEERVGGKQKEVYDVFDNLAYTVLGQKPEEVDGKLQKSSEFYNGLLDELKQLREKKGELTVDAEVKRLTDEVERLKAEGGGKHWEQTFNTEKAKWQTKEQELTDKIKQLTEGAYSSSVKNEIASAKSELKINPDVPKEAVDALFASIESDLIKNSKKDGDKIVYLKPDGSIITNAELGPDNAKGILQKRMASVLLKDDKSGGGADETIKGSIKTTKVEGKDDKKSLVLSQGTFKNRLEFTKIATEALKSEGITKSNPEFKKLLAQAYLEYNIKDLTRR